MSDLSFKPYYDEEDLGDDEDDNSLSNERLVDSEDENDIVFIQKADQNDVKR